jgi:hypothetical protein
MLNIRERLAKNYINWIGWSTKKKYVIIESDDWGTIRMPSKTVYLELIKQNIPVDKFSFDKHDSLESTEDLEALFDVLYSVKDNNGHPAVLTAYHVMANPNFEEIEKNGKTQYVYETILDTYNRNPHTKDSFTAIQKGMKMGIYIPQFHGREHIHVGRWMEAINSKSSKEQLGFKHKAIISSFGIDDIEPYKKDYFKGFDFDNELEEQEVISIHKDGLKLFKEIFGMDSITFTAQGSVWGNSILEMLKSEGIELIGGQQLQPNGYKGYKRIDKIWGKRNDYGLTHWRRNVLFEPSRNQEFDWVQKCISEMEIAFRWGKPAVISSHRENFIGSIFPENREKSLQNLKNLLIALLKKWPDIEFISSEQLAKVMITDLNKD